MEMHQVRYFLATVSELNFTKAAEKCNVTQPSLTRAIKQLEDELGGDLFRRERPQAQLTELGHRMHPLLKQCYESAMGARSLASAIKNGEIGTLKLALSHTINLELLTSHLQELTGVFGRLDLQLLRGTGPELLEILKSGEAELAVAAELGDAWERLDRWPLFSEDFALVLNVNHPLAARDTVAIADLRQERWLRRVHCEHREQLTSLVRGHDLDIDRGHQLNCEHDLATMLEADLGVAFVPKSVVPAPAFRHIPVSGIELRRTVFVYGVAGRERTTAAGAILRKLRAADWSRYAI